MTKIPNLVSPFSKGGKGDFLEFGIWILPFDWAQGGEPVEPFVICCLVLGIFSIMDTTVYDIHYYFFLFMGHNPALPSGERMII